MFLETKVFFNFHDQNTNIEHRLPISCTPDEWSNWTEYDIELDDSFIADIEIIAVHDINDWVDHDGAFYAGFTSYEAEDEETINMILNKWKKKLVELGWANENDNFTQVIKND